MPALLDNGFNVTTLTAPGREGKSYVVVHDLAHNRLVRWKHKLVTNLPLRVDELSEYVAKQRNGWEPEEVAERIIKIPGEQLERWSRGEGGPWELTDEFNDGQCDFVLDEVHNFCPKTDRQRGQQWEDWLGEIGHTGLQRVQFITQAPEKVHPTIFAHAHARYVIEKSDRRRSKWLNIPLSDLYEVVGSLTNRYEPIVYRIEQIKDAGGKWKKNAETAYTFNPKVFDLYVSKSKAGGQSDDQAAAEHSKQEYEKRPRFFPAKRDYDQDGHPSWTLPTWLWAVTRNPLAVAKVLGVVALITFAANGGIGFMIGQWLRHADGFIKSAINVDALTPGGLDGAATAHVPDPARVPPPPNAPRYDHRRLIADLAARVKADHENDVNGSRIAALAPSWVQFRSGVVAGIGDTLADGPFAGRRIDAIDFKHRVVTLDDGRDLRMRGDNAEAPAADAGVPELLQRAQEAIGEAEPVAGRERSVLVARRVEHEPRGAAATAEPGNGAQLRGGGQAR